eukprot:jgi/Psemu1/5910/gm1.5910_g
MEEEAQGELVEVVEDMLKQATVELCICTIAQHKVLLEQTPNLQVIPAQATMDAVLRLFTTRQAVYIPFEMIPLLLDKNFSPQQAFLLVHQCQSQGPLDLYTEQLTATVATLTFNQLLKANDANESKRTEDDKPKSPREAFGEATLKRLLIIITRKKGTEDDKKQEALSAILTDSILDAVDHFCIASPVDVTTGAVSCPKQWRLYEYNERDVANGLLPMAFVPLSAVKAKAQLVEAKELTAYRTITTDSGTTMTHKETIMALVTNKDYIWTDWTKAMVQLKAYLPALLGVLLGWKHPVIKRYSGGYVLIERMILTIREAL